MTHERKGTLGHCLTKPARASLQQQDSLPDCGTLVVDLFHFLPPLFFRKSVPDTHWKHFPVAIGKQGFCQGGVLGSEVAWQDTGNYLPRSLGKEVALATKDLQMIDPPAVPSSSSCLTQNRSRYPLHGPTATGLLWPLPFSSSLSLATLPQLLFIFRRFLELVKVISTLRPCTVICLESLSFRSLPDVFLLVLLPVESTVGQKSQDHRGHILPALFTTVLLNFSGHR